MTGRMRRRVKFDTAAGASDCDCVESRAREKSLKSAQLVWLGHLTGVTALSLSEQRLA
jgi:hypothetical protein